MAKTVTVIPATVNPFTGMPVTGLHKRRVAGYARVSTDKDEQFTSYEAQVDYYTKYIKANPEWEFVTVYTDEGISGTSTKRRDGFNTMIDAALNGRIDLIVTKSVSRFARNTVDSLSTIRKLKEKGVEVYFEKENIWTLDSKGELLLTIMSSLAQEESRSISENITWGKRKSASDGKVSLAYRNFLGYEKGPNGTPVINQKQAKTVRRIYRNFMAGQTAWAIAKELTADGIPTPAGKSQWHTTTVESILTNEKYKGAALLQKTFTVDYLSKKIKTNEGEVPQYFVEDSHPAIIPPEEWDQVQKEFVRRHSLGRKYSGNSIFSTHIICGDCGAFFGAKVWNSTDKYRHTVWQCNDKFKGGKKCATPHLSEDKIKSGFVQAFNRLFDGKEEIIANCKEVARLFSDTAELDRKKDALQQELCVLSELIRKLIEENATTVQDQNSYLEKYNGYADRYKTVTDAIGALEKEILLKHARADAFRNFIRTFEAVESKLLTFDAKLWALTVDKVKVMADGSLHYIFKNGADITA